jgi:hypothetical protein
MCVVIVLLRKIIITSVLLNKTYFCSFVLQRNKLVDIWCCKPISNIFGAVNKKKLFELGAVNELYNFDLVLSHYLYSLRRSF